MSDPGTRKRDDDGPRPFMNLDWDLERVLETLRPLVATQATTDALLITTSVAALMPVVQATMSFVMAATHTYQTTHREDTNANTASMPLLIESVRQIFARPPVAAPQAAAVYSNANQLAVT
jgi:hypothetical protein